MHLLAVGLSIAFLLAAEEADQSKQGNLSFSYIQLVSGCFVFGNDAQRNANKGTEHPDERPLTLLDTKNVLTKLLTSQTVSLYLTRAIGPLGPCQVIIVYLEASKHDHVG